MLVICSKCEARLQLDESKIPSQLFKVRCPKCQASINVKPSTAAEAAAADPKSLPAEMNPPSSQISPFQPPIVAAPFKPAEVSNTPEPKQSDLDSNAVAKLLAAALRHNEIGPEKKRAEKRPVWDRRKALVCTDPAHRVEVANGLLAQDYEVFVAENTEEALGRMREDRIDVLILEANFDPVEQGFAFVSREVKSMRPSERRRLFLIYLTPAARTMDLHAAFLHNVNLVLNPSDVDRLPDALEVSIRHYNELYRDFNRALDVTAI